LITLLRGDCQLNLDAINTIYTVDEENEDEDEGDLHQIVIIVSEKTDTGELYLHAILQFRNQGALRDERKELSPPSEWQGDDEEHENSHFQHQ
jgi:hypothetical protein